jgi:hypothetical protein
VPRRACSLRSCSGKPDRVARCILPCQLREAWALSDDTVAVKSLKSAEKEPKDEREAKVELEGAERLERESAKPIVNRLATLSGYRSRRRLLALNNHHQR